MWAKGHTKALTCLALVKRPCPISVPPAVTKTEPSGYRETKAGFGPTIAPLNLRTVRER